MKRAFISHSTRFLDKAEESKLDWNEILDVKLSRWVLEIVVDELEKLQVEGFCTSFFDRRDNWNRDYFKAPLNGELSRASVGIILATKRAAESRWVHREASILHWRRIHNPYISLHFVVVPASIKGYLKERFDTVDIESANIFPIEIAEDINTADRLEDYLRGKNWEDILRAQIRAWIQECNEPSSDIRVRDFSSLIEPLPISGIRDLIQDLRRADDAADSNSRMPDNPHEIRDIAAHILADADPSVPVVNALLRWVSRAPGNEPVFRQIFRLIATRAAPPTFATKLNERIFSELISVTRLITNGPSFVEHYLDAALGPVRARTNPQSRYKLNSKFRPGSKASAVVKTVVDAIGKSRPMPGDIIVLELSEYWLADDELIECVKNALSELGLKGFRVAIVIVSVRKRAGENESGLGACIDCRNIRLGEGHDSSEEYYGANLGKLFESPEDQNSGGYYVR